MHDPGSNFLAMDGYVKWLCPEKVSPGYSYNAWNGTNIAYDGKCSTWAASTSAKTQNGQPVVMTFSVD